VYIGVVDDGARMELSTVMVAHIEVLHSGLDYSGCDMCEGTLIVTVYRERGCVIRRVLGVLP